VSPFILQGVLAGDVRDTKPQMIIGGGNIQRIIMYPKSCGMSMIPIQTIVERRSAGKIP
jgi:hypothetical protein